MVEITLRKNNGEPNGIVFVDDVDKDLAAYTWRADDKGYAVRREAGVVYRMHLIILRRKAPQGRASMLGDHKDRNPANNTRKNLRWATHSQSSMNRDGWGKGGLTKYKGIHWNKQSSCWTASITSDHRIYPLGRFPTAEGAAFAYDQKAKELHGRFAVLNFPDPYK